MKLTSIIIFVLLMASGLSAYDIEGGRQAGMAGTVLLSKPSAYGLLNCPTNSLRSKQFIIESVVSRKYGLADLDQVSILAAYRLKKITCAFGFSQMGPPDYYTEKNIRAVLSYHQNSITAILITSGRLIEIGGKFGKLRAASAGLGISYHKDNFYFGITVDDLNRPEIARNVDGENMKVNLFAEIDGSKRHSITGRLVLEKYEKPHLSLGQFINLSDKNGLFWGLSFDPLKYGGGFEIEYRKFSIVYGVSHHPVLGFSHYISLTFLTGRRDKAN